MKKLVLAAMSVVLLSGVAFAEFNLRTSYDLSGEFEMKSPGYSSYNSKTDVDSSFTLSGEYLRRVVGDYLAVGGGFEFLIPRFRDVNNISNWYDEAFFFLPLYLSIQTNPIPPVRELFFRVNIGINVIYTDSGVGSAWDEKGGLYYALVTGWEFPFGLFFDLTYASYDASLESNTYINEFDINYSRVSVGVGYKFGRPRR